MWGRDTQSGHERLWGRGGWWRTGASGLKGQICRGGGGRSADPGLMAAVRDDGPALLGLELHSPGGQRAPGGHKVGLWQAGPGRSMFIRHTAAEGTGSGDGNSWMQRLCGASRGTLFIGQKRM